ncbi:MAG: peptidyl-prolyl cis-trans isomerase [Acidobacteriota bacterium]
MLKILRENLKSLSWILWIVIVVFVLLVFAEVDAFAPQQSGGRNAPAAWAGDLKVTFGELEQAYRAAERRAREQRQGEFTSEMSDLLRAQSLQQLMDQKIVLAEAKNIGLSVSDREVRKAILDIPWLKDSDGEFVGPEQYRTLATRNFGSPLALEELMREDLLLRKFEQALQDSAFVVEEDAERAYREEVERASIRYVTLLSRSVVDDVDTPEDELQTFFEENQEEYRLPEQRSVGYLLVDEVLLRQSLDISDESIQTYYDANQADFQQDEEVRARHILLNTGAQRSAEQALTELQAVRARIDAGEDFDALARQLSEDQGSKDRGGDLGFFPRGRMNPQFEEAAFGADVDEVVGPFETPFGVHIVQTTARRDAGIRPLAEVRSQVRSRVLNEQVETVAQGASGEVLASVEQLAEVSEDSFSALADEEQNIRYLVTEPFGRQDPIPGVGLAQDFASAAFELEVGEISEPVDTPRGWALLYLKDIREPRVPELSEVENRVRQALRLDKQERQVLDQLQSARQRIEGGEDFETVAASLDLDVKQSGPWNASFGRIPELSTASSEVVQQALTLEEGTLGGPLSYPLGGVLFEVTERVRMDEEEFEERKENVIDSLRFQEYQRQRDSLIAERRRELDIKYARQLVESIGGLDGGGDAGAP